MITMNLEQLYHRYLYDGPIKDLPGCGCQDGLAKVMSDAGLITLVIKNHYSKGVVTEKSKLFFYNGKHPPDKMELFALLSEILGINKIDV